MRKVLFISILFFNLALWSQATASFTASVTIVEPLKLTNVANLNFSEIRAGSGGTVTMTADGMRNGFGGVELGKENNISPATFNIFGKPGTRVNIKIPEGEYYLTNGKQNIIIRDFTSNWSSGGWLKEENNLLKVGASIVVEANQEPGYYTSVRPLEIVVNYD